MNLGDGYDSITRLETTSFHTSNVRSRFPNKSQNSFVCEFADGTYKKFEALCYVLPIMVKVKRKGKEIKCYDTLEKTSEGYPIYQEPIKEGRVKTSSPLDNIRDV